MQQDNKVSIELTAEKLAAIGQKAAAFRAELNDLLVVNLTAEERLNMLRMGSKSVDFVTRTLDYAGNNPGLVPAYLNLDEARKDLTLVRTLEPIIQEVGTVLRGLEDLSMLAGSEAFDAALIFYHSVKGASRAQVPGTQAIYDDLSRQFPRPSRKAK